MAAEAPAGEDFVPWVQQAPFEAVVERLEELTEAERRKLSKAVAAAWRGPGRVPSRDGRLAIALMGVCAWGDARRLQLWEVAWQDRGRFDAALLRVFAARRPEWIDRWVERELTGEFGAGWLLIRRLVRDGICARPTIDEYVIGMVRGRLGTWSGDGSLVEALEADPGLLADEVWRAFEVDPANGNLFQGEGVAGDAAARSWGGALCHLAQKGAIDRFRLLEASAEALRRGIQLKGTGFHVQLHEQLAPTPQERERLAPVYLDLLGHRVDAVAGFALRQLKGLAEEKKVDGRSLAERLPAALDRQTKAPALAALSLLRRLVKDDRALALPAGVAAARGLAHANAEVQEKALDFLESAAEGPAPELAAALAARIDGVAPSQRGRAEALLARVSPGSVSPSPRGAAAPPPAQEDEEALFADLLAEAAALPPRLRALAGIDELLAALQSGEPAPAWAPPAAELPRLDPAAAVAPVASLDELIDLLLACLENAEDPVEIERCLDGLCRFGGERPPDFGQRTAALLQRAQQPASGWGVWSGVGAVLAGLVAAWLAGAPPPAPPPSGRQAPGPELFFLARLGEIVPRFRGRPAGGGSRGLLALPTHRGGWIDPRAFVERVRQQLAERPEGPGELDLLQALLRLAPARFRSSRAPRSPGRRSRCGRRSTAGR